MNENLKMQCFFGDAGRRCPKIREKYQYIKDKLSTQDCSMDAFVVRQYTSLNLLLKIIMGVHMLATYAKHLEGHVPLFFVRYFAQLAYLNIFRNANEEEAD